MAGMIANISSNLGYDQVAEKVLDTGMMICVNGSIAYICVRNIPNMQIAIDKLIVGDIRKTTQVFFTILANSITFYCAGPESWLSKASCFALSTAIGCRLGGKVNDYHRLAFRKLLANCAENQREINEEEE